MKRSRGEVAGWPVSAFRRGTASRREDASPSGEASTSHGSEHRALFGSNPPTADVAGARLGGWRTTPLDVASNLSALMSGVAGTESVETMAEDFAEFMSGADESPSIARRSSAEVYEDHRDRSRSLDGNANGREGQSPQDVRSDRADPSFQERLRRRLWRLHVMTRPAPSAEVH